MHIKTSLAHHKLLFLSWNVSLDTYQSPEEEEEDEEYVRGLHHSEVSQGGRREIISGL